MRWLILRLTTLLGTGLIITACNSGGDLNLNSNLPSGTYMMITTSQSSDLCYFDPSLVSIDSQGKLCGFSTKECLPINVALDPCLDAIAESASYSATMKWTGCQLSSTNVFTGIMNVSYTSKSKQNLTCTSKVTIIPR
jgi:hypothetical protein